MGTYQTIVMFVIIFLGEYIIPEDSNYSPRQGDFVYPGRAYSWDGSDLYKKLRDGDDDPGPSRHLTVLFNAFVFLQIFNMICARKINDEFNIFEGIFHNYTFLIIISIITLIQIIIVQFTQDVFQVARKGLYWGQWMVCIGIGLTAFPINFFTKFFPNKCFPNFDKKKNKNKKQNQVLDGPSQPPKQESDERDEIQMEKEAEEV